MLTSGAVILDAARATARARDLCAFIDASPMPYQAVAESARRLVEAGYSELLESAAGNLEPGRGYFVARNSPTLLAFRLAAGAPPETGGGPAGGGGDPPNPPLQPPAGFRAGGHRHAA